MEIFLEDNKINNDNSLMNSISNNIGNIQNEFITTTFGNIINSAIDTGLRLILPDSIENNIIDIKNSIISGGFEGGINSLISNAIDIGKSILGLNNTNISSITELKDILVNGGLKESISNFMNNGISNAQNESLLSESNLEILNEGKEVITSNITNEIDMNLKEQMNSIEKIQKYCNKWDNYYNNNEFEKMEKMYNKIMNEKENILPLEYLLNKINQIENIQNLIKNSNNNFEISSVQMALAERL